MRRAFPEGELIYLFNADIARIPRTRYALQDPDDAAELPLDLPENHEHHSLWKLREALLAVEVREDEACEWTWPRLVGRARDTVRLRAPAAASDPLLSTRPAFVPAHVLEASGFPVSGTQTAIPNGAPWLDRAMEFTGRQPVSIRCQLDPAALWIELPLSDEAVIAKLSQMPRTDRRRNRWRCRISISMPRADLAFSRFCSPIGRCGETLDRGVPTRPSGGPISVVGSRSRNADAR